MDARSVPASLFYALAADIEDVLLRWHGHPEDCETLRRVADDLLAAAQKDGPYLTAADLQVEDALAGWSE